MTSLRKFVLIAALVASATLPLIYLAITMPEAKAHGAQDKAAAKPAYLPIPGGDYRLDVAHSVIGFSILHNDWLWLRGASRISPARFVSMIRT